MIQFLPIRIKCKKSTPLSKHFFILSKTYPCRKLTRKIPKKPFVSLLRSLAARRRRLSPERYALKHWNVRLVCQLFGFLAQSSFVSNHRCRSVVIGALALNGPEISFVKVLHSVESLKLLVKNDRTYSTARFNAFWRNMAQEVD